MQKNFIFYSFVSALCLLLHNAILIIGNFFQINLIILIIFSFFVVTTFAYALHSILTFRHHFNTYSYCRYMLSMSINIPLAFATTWFWHEAIGLSMIWSAPLASVCMIFVNFLIGRWAIVGRRSSWASTE